MKTIEDARNILSLCEQASDVAGAQLTAEGIPCIECCACCGVPAMLIWAFPELAGEWEKLKEGR